MFDLNLDRLPSGRSELPIDGSLALDLESDGDGSLGAGEIRGILQVETMDQKILVHGELDVSRTMECHRCSEASRQEYVAQMDVLILRNPLRGSDRDPASEDDSWVIHQQGGIVDLSEALREAVFLDEPIHVECGRETCLPYASADAEGEDEETIDPRWAALKDLRERGGSND
jgi:uncharacterized metal-binding protein YceD (DUF177 family)